MLRKEMQEMLIIFKLFILFYNQSFENAVVSFVKGASERNEFLKKKKKQSYMMKKSGQTRQRTNNLRDKLIWGWTPSDDKGWCIIAQ